MQAQRGIVFNDFFVVLRRTMRPFCRCTILALGNVSLNSAEFIFEILWWTGLSLLVIGYFAAKPRAISFAR